MGGGGGVISNSFLLFLNVRHAFHMAPTPDRGGNGDSCLTALEFSQVLVSNYI